MNYQELISKPASKKILLATFEGVKRAKIFTSEGGGIYSRIVDRMVSSVKHGQSSLTEAASSSLSAGEFFYSFTDSKLFIRLTGDADPIEEDIYLTYRFHVSTIPMNLPHDLASGDPVEWIGLVKSIGNLKFELDFEQVGIALESKSSIVLENSDKYFDELYDTHIFEGQRIIFYSWSPSIPLSEAKTIYKGTIQDKRYSENDVRFSIIDDIFRLREELNLGVFSASDGTLSDSDIDRVKPRVYGRVETMSMVGVDKVLNGYAIGNIAGVSGSNKITGTNFRKNIVQGDTIQFTLNEDDFSFTVDAIDSDTQVEISEELEFNFTGVAATVSPAINNRFKNREWFIAGHELNNFVGNVEEVISNTRLRLDSTESLFVGDIVEINGQIRSIFRISFDQVILNQALSPLPAVNDDFTRLPVYNVFFENRRLIRDRDYQIINTGGEAKIKLEDLAEFNVSPVRTTNFTLTFTNGSRSITTAADVDLNSIFQPRDWIRSNDINHTTWYEINSVTEQALTIVEVYAGSTTTSVGRRKQPQYVGDDSLMTVSCLGKGTPLIQTPAQVVKDILEDVGLTNINTNAFSEASNDAPYMVSLPIKAKATASKTIDLINESCFGSLTQDANFNFKYSILNTDRPADYFSVSDDDILSFKPVAKNSIVNQVVVNYRPFVDVNTGEDTFRVQSLGNEFVNSTSGIKKTREVTSYLYDDDAAETITQRLAFFNSLTQNVITISAKLRFALSQLNDRVGLRFGRLFRRYGSTTSGLKIGLINSISKSDTDTTIQVNDLSGVFSRGGSIVEDSAPDFSAANDEERMVSVFICDNDSETPDVASEEGLGDNLIT